MRIATHRVALRCDQTAPRRIALHRGRTARDGVTAVHRGRTARHGVTALPYGRTARDGVTALHRGRTAQHGVVALLGALVLLATTLVAGPATSAATRTDLPVATSGGVLLAARSDTLIVGPGRIGSLRMGSTTRSATRRGWLSYSRSCGWGPGRRALRFDASGGEVFKAFPDKVSKGRVRSMHAFGEVFTREGIRAASLAEAGPPGSTLTQLRAAYPRLRYLGTWRDYLADRDWPVHTTGSRKRGWLDFYLDPDALTVRFVQVRTHGVRWGEPQFGC